MQTACWELACPEQAFRAWHDCTHMRRFSVVLVKWLVNHSLPYAVADRGVSGPWGPQFCGALCNGETQRLPAGCAGSPPVGSEAEPRRQPHFGNNILKIGWKSDILVAVYTHNSDLITDHGKSSYPSRLDLYEICHLSGNHSHIIITCSRLATKATVTPDRTISGSYDWLRLGQGANDRQCLLRYPAAVAYGDWSLRVVALSRTIRKYRWQEPS